MFVEAGIAFIPFVQGCFQEVSRWSMYYQGSMIKGYEKESAFSPFLCPAFQKYCCCQMKELGTIAMFWKDEWTVSSIILWGWSLGDVAHEKKNQKTLQKSTFTWQDHLSGSIMQCFLQATRISGSLLVSQCKSVAPHAKSIWFYICMKSPNYWTEWFTRTRSISVINTRAKGFKGRSNC